MTLPLRHLDPFELEFFRYNGFLSLPAFIDADEIGALRGLFDRLFSARAGWAEGDALDLCGNERDGPARLPQLVSPSRYAPELQRSSHAGRHCRVTRAAIAAGNPAFGPSFRTRAPRVPGVTALAPGATGLCRSSQRPLMMSTRPSPVTSPMASEYPASGAA